MYRFFATTLAGLALASLSYSPSSICNSTLLHLLLPLSSSPFGPSGSDEKEFRGLPIYNCDRRAAGIGRGEGEKSQMHRFYAFPFRSLVPFLPLSYATFNLAVLLKCRKSSARPKRWQWGSGRERERESAGKQIPHLQNEREESPPASRTTSLCSNRTSIRRTHSSRQAPFPGYARNNRTSLFSGCMRERSEGARCSRAMRFSFRSSPPQFLLVDRPTDHLTHPRSILNFLFTLFFFRPFGYCLSSETTRLRSREGINHGLARRTDYSLHSRPRPSSTSTSILRGGGTCSRSPR